MSDIVLEMRNISKAFIGVKALTDVSISVRRGEVHAICGENGAGKSTLMKILNGIYPLDAGEIYIKGEKAQICSPLDAQRRGISIIFQEFNLVNTLSVAENIFLGRLSDRIGRVRWTDIYRRAQEQLDNIGADIDPRAIVSNLSVSQKQMVEIAKAISYKADIVVMDEPTATLTESEVQKLFRVIEEFRSKGITTIYISHKMDEVFALSDRITVLRDGKAITTVDTCATTRDFIVSTMVGRCLDNEYPRRSGFRSDGIALSARNISRKKTLYDLSLSVRKGEILGIAGLVGAGRTELVRAIFAADPVNCKRIEVGGRPARIGSPCQAIAHGIALVNEDRKELGLVLKLPVAQNITIVKKDAAVRNGWYSRRRENAAARQMIEKLNIKTPSVKQKCVYLSGGNQQKVVLAKWLLADADILMLDEPTRGIDVGSKYEIYTMINRLADEGKAIIMISSELPEILGLSDRILVIHNGRMVGEFDNHDKRITAEQVLQSAIG